MTGKLSPLRIVTIFGTRPEAIKLAPVIKELQKYPEHFEVVIIVTAQHRYMLDQVLKLFSITPDEDLNIMLHDQSLFQITILSLQGLENVLQHYKPDLVMVQGDTTTVFAASLASFYLKIPVAHVEAGLRTEDKYNPFPEEMNRRLTSIITDLHFAPTEIARQNLIDNGISEEKIFLTGNTITDALMDILDKVEDYAHPILKNIAPEVDKILLVEAHRRENLGEPMENICNALENLSKEFPKIGIIFSVHKNPNVEKTVRTKLSGKKRIYLVEPMEYPTLVNLQKRSYIILTDSGGIQEEAPSLGKPVLVLRKVTERPEGIKAGVAKLVGTDPQKIYYEASRLIKDRDYYQEMSKISNPYGDGKASQRIKEAILYYFGQRKKKPESFIAFQDTMKSENKDRKYLSG